MNFNILIWISFGFFYYSAAVETSSDTSPTSIISGHSTTQSTSTTASVATTQSRQTTTATTQSRQTTTGSTTKEEHSSTDSTTKDSHNSTGSTTREAQSNTDSTTKDSHSSTVSTTEKISTATGSTTKDAQSNTDSTTKDSHSSTVSTTEKISTATGSTTKEAHGNTDSTTKDSHSSTVPTTEKISTAAGPTRNETDIITEATTIKTDIATDATTNKTDIATDATTNKTDIATATTKSFPTTFAIGPNETSSTPTVIKACSKDTCGSSLAECINLEDSFICRCPFGYYFVSQNCIQGRSFPGTLNVNSSYTDDIKNTSSSAYKQLHGDVNELFTQVFGNNTDYKETIISEVRQVSTRSQGVIVDVISTFLISTTVSADDVARNIKSAISSNDKFNEYREASPCDVFGCDLMTTTCRNELDTAVCLCQEGFYKHSPTDKSCRDCDPTCVQENNQRCVQVDRQGIVPKCVCLSGYETDGNGKCKQCAFGYTGEECGDNTTLIALVVGIVGLALLIALTGGIIGIAVRLTKYKRYSDQEHQELIHKSGSRETNNSIRGIDQSPFALSLRAQANIYSDNADQMSTQETVRNGHATTDVDKDDDQGVSYEKF